MTVLVMAAGLPACGRHRSRTVRGRDPSGPTERVGQDGAIPPVFATARRLDGEVTDALAIKVTSQCAQELPPRPHLTASRRRLHPNVGDHTVLLDRRDRSGAPADPRSNRGRSA